MEPTTKEWLPALGKATTDALGEDVPAGCTFLDAVQHGRDLPAVKWSVALQLQGTAFHLAVCNDHVHTVQALLQLYGQHCLPSLVIRKRVLHQGKCATNSRQR